MTWVGKGLFQLTSDSPLWRGGKAGAQGLYLEAGTEAGTLRNAACCLASPGWLSYLSDRAQAQLLRMALPMVGSCVREQIIKCSTNMSTSPSNAERFSSELLSCRVCQVDN